MDNKDFACILENYYRNIETMQPSDQRMKVKRDELNSADVWRGIVDPSKGPGMYTPSIDEEEVAKPDKMSKMRELIEAEIKRAPKKMTYAIRVLNGLLKKMESL